MVNIRMPMMLEAKYFNRFKVVRFVMCGEENFAVTVKGEDARHGFGYYNPKYFKTKQEVKCYLTKNMR